MSARRWVVLAVGTFAQAATCSFIYGVPMLVPALRAEGLSLFAAGLLMSAPMAGLLLTLIAWGAAADRFGERIVIGTGVGAAAVLLLGAVVVPGPAGLAIALALAGAAGASVNAASGRMVMGWFPPRERGLAMGTRQTAQPLGVAIAAIGLPPLSHAFGVHHALLFPAVLCLLAAALVLTVTSDPPRPARSADAPAAGSPYRGSWQLGRVHLASAMLVVPQFALASFTLAYLVGERDWNPSVAGRMIFGFLVAGALGRVAAGVWSDLVGARLRPMRQLAIASATLMGVIAAGAAAGSWIVIIGFAVGAVVTVADNGLAYTAVAELAGTEWSGRALGVQNTVQNVAAVLAAPLLAALISGTSYAVGFVVTAIFPLLAIPITPVRAERVAREAPLQAARS